MGLTRTGLQISSALTALLLCAQAAGAPAGANVQLRHVDLQSGDDTALLTLRLSAPTAAHVFRLHHPERLVVDLPRTRPTGSMPSMSSAGAVAALRSGWTPQHALRVVLELNAPMQLHQQTRKSGDWQLRIALNAATPAAGATRPRLTASSGALPKATSAVPEVEALAAATPVLNAPVASIRPAHAPGAAERPIVIAVDAGHGGDDPGASGHAGTHEKDVTLAIARALAARIDHEPGMRAVLTRDGDYFVALSNDRQRARSRARRLVRLDPRRLRCAIRRSPAPPSMFFRARRLERGREARLAEQENAADLQGRHFAGRSKRRICARCCSICRRAPASARAPRPPTACSVRSTGVGAVRKREVQQAAFVVLKSPVFPRCWSRPPTSPIPPKSAAAHAGASNSAWRRRSSAASTAISASSHPREPVRARPRPAGAIARRPARDGA